MTDGGASKRARRVPNIVGDRKGEGNVFGLLGKFLMSSDVNA